jgi:hypothetical protein
MVKTPRVYVWFVLGLFFFPSFFLGKDLYILWLPLYIILYYIYICFMLLFYYFLFIFFLWGWKGVVCVSAIFVDFGFNNSSFC